LSLIVPDSPENGARVERGWSADWLFFAQSGHTHGS
jgi:hypothetical protein